jgi:hypothetical protein
MGRRFASHIVWRERVLGRIDRMDRARQRKEICRMEQDTITDFEMAAAMAEFGGSFAQVLGRAWQVADEINRAKIVATWPDYCAEYRELARLKRATKS